MIENLNRYKFLFLDRDGVVNVERKNDYVKNQSEFVFEKNSLQAIAILTSYFDEIFIVTNQRGIGRGIFSESDLLQVHQYMLSEIEKEGGRLSAIYFCPDINSSSINRKPNIGMAFQILRDFPEVSFDQSIMVGNSRSDIEFGNKLNMHTVLVGDKYQKTDKIYKEVDYYCDNLYKFALLIEKKTDKMNTISKRLTESIAVKQKIVEDVNLQETIMIAERLMEDALTNGHSVYFCGNGGNVSECIVFYLSFIV